MRDIYADGTMHATKVDSDSNLIHILIIPPAIAQIVQQEGSNPVLQTDGTFRTNKYGIQMFHVVAHTNTLKSYPFAYYFGVIVEPKAILTDAEQALINAVDNLFTEAKNMLCIWHIPMNIYANHKMNFQI
ncbi:hypothetical protein PsorP6_016678 [Peronosclerospora sorghi]|uniref:Uncharacterized protein n=1 Tax=Peronosclerospora sorghi TaxID=230839 RepID=A0ACC0VPU1_9STRA|nr:hypothetical protein PsorP6_016678 [Peronosclerospora sorghi]